jgi:hypothetical protein
MADKLKRYLFESLPEYFKVFDSNKDGNFCGSLERFFSIFDYDVEYAYYDKIKPLGNLVSPEDIFESHLFLLASNYGKPPTLFKNPAPYRHLLSGFRELMSYKGTLTGLEKLFKLLGALITVIDQTPPLSIYDTQQFYDNRVIYDYDYREFFFIRVEITKDPNSNKLFLSNYADYEQELFDLIYFMIPINVFVNELVVDGVLLDTYLTTHNPEDKGDTTVYNLRTNSNHNILIQNA